MRSSRFIPIAVLAVVFCISARRASAQSGPVLRVKVDLQPIAVRVTDKQGNDALGLSAEDFAIFEDGKPQNIAFFDAGHEPVSLVILVDSSSAISSEGRLGSAESLAIEFMRTGRMGDEIAAMDFTDQMGPFQQLTQAQVLNPSSLTLQPAPGGGSALFDATASALCHLRASKNLRQAVIVITTGIDQHSRITLEQLIDLVRSSRAQLFMIGLHSRPEFHFDGHTEEKLTLASGRDIDNPAIVFERLARESGAQSFFLGSEGKLEAALKAVSNTLQTQYTLAYYPRNTAKPLRRIDVKVKRSGLKVTTRRIVASEISGDESVQFAPGTCEVSTEHNPYPYESTITRGSDGKIYRDDFSDRRSGWPNHEDSHYANGAYEISADRIQTITPANSSNLGRRLGAPVQQFQIPKDVVAANGPWWRNFRASVRVDAERMISARDDLRISQLPVGISPAAGLVFRLNQDGYYALLLSGSERTKDFSFQLIKKDFLSMSSTEIVPWTRLAGLQRSVKSSPGIKLSVESIGDQITLFVDDRQVQRLQDETYDSGYVGFVVTGQARASFRDLVVQERP